MDNNVDLGTNEQKTTKFTNKSYYTRTVMPILHTLTGFTAFPFTENHKTGKLSLNVKTFTFLYSICVYIPLFSLSVYVMYQMFVIVAHTKDFNEKTQSYLVASIMLENILAPLFVVVESKKIENFLTKWKENEDYYKLMNIKLDMDLPNAWYILIGCVVFIATAPTGASFLLAAVRTYPHYAVVSISGGVIYSINSSLYLCTELVIKATSENFRKHLEKDISEKNLSARLLEDYRLAWMSLSDLVCEFANSFALSITWHLSTTVVFLTLVTYYFAAMFRTNVTNSLYVNFLLSCCGPFIGIVVIYFECEMGDRLVKYCTKDMADILSSLKSYSPELYDSVTVKVFLEGLIQFCPRLDIQGCYVIDTQLFGSIVLAIVAYIIVIVQVREEE